MVSTTFLFTPGPKRTANLAASKFYRQESFSILNKKISLCSFQENCAILVTHWKGEAYYMTVALSENLRKLRKAQKLTQEQLAEAMGVTVGAVSKWESGASTPDIALIMDLAEFFETSVDVLLGFSHQSATLDTTICQLRLLRGKREYDGAFQLAEKALLKYPNSFSVVYECAITYQLAGLGSPNRAVLQRSRELLTRSLELIDQNQDPEISPISIRNAIAQSYLSQGDRAKALELFKENNIMGINNGIIGTQLAKDRQTCQEAMFYLSKSMVNADSLLIEFSSGFVHVCLHEGRSQEALDFLRLLIPFEAGLRKPGKVSYLDKIQVLLLGLCALVHLDLGDRAEAASCLRSARKIALTFDADPDYSAGQIRFTSFDNFAAAYDSFGTTALQGLEQLLEETRELCPSIWDLWKEIRHEET